MSIAILFWQVIINEKVRHYIIFAEVELNRNSGLSVSSSSSSGSSSDMYDSGVCAVPDLNDFLLDGYTVDQKLGVMLGTAPPPPTSSASAAQYINGQCIFIYFFLLSFPVTSGFSL